MDKSTLNNINNKEIKNVAECKEAQANEIAALQAIFMVLKNALMIYIILYINISHTIVL